MKEFFKDFKEFISRGNILDMAVGVIIGTAFTAIVTSLVNDVVMPIIGVIIGGIDFTALSVVVGGASVNYGVFCINIVNFLIIALCVFSFIRVLTRISEKTKLIEPKEETKEKVEEPDVLLLKEIRDLLAKDKTDK